MSTSFIQRLSKAVFYHMTNKFPSLWIDSTASSMEAFWDALKGRIWRHNVDVQWKTPAHFFGGMIPVVLA